MVRKPPALPVNLSGSQGSRGGYERGRAKDVRFTQVGSSARTRGVVSTATVLGRGGQSTSTGRLGTEATTLLGVLRGVRGLLTQRGGAPPAV